MTHRLTPLAEGLPEGVPFVGPEAQERARGAPFQARLGANESPFGPSPRAVTAMAEAAAEGWMYGDPDHAALRHALSDHLAVPPQAIMCGEGIDGLLGYLVRLIVGPGDAVVTSLGAYPTFNYHVAGFGGTIHTVPYRDDHEDPLALAAKSRDVGAKLVYLANPDNPMGSVIPAEAVARLVRDLPQDCLLCLDEAYGEFAPEGTVLPLDVTDDRVIRMRTFSKAHGLAGLRVGYALGGPRLIGAFNKVRNHFGLGRVAQAGALAALQDQAWLRHVIDAVATSRADIAQIATENGLHPLPSATNFVTVDCGADGAFARAVLAALLDGGIFVRMPGVAPLDRCIRVSCGGADDMAALRSAIKPALATARSQK